MIYLQRLVDQGKSSWNISEFGAALHVWWPKFASSLLLLSSALTFLRYFMGPFFLDSQFQANMSKRAMFSEKSCKHARMFAMVFCTE